MRATWSETRHAQSRCPFCGLKLDTAGSPDGRGPEPGDLSVCAACASPLIFTDGLGLRAMTAAEFDRLEAPLKERLRKFQRAVRSTDRRSSPP